MSLASETTAEEKTTGEQASASQSSQVEPPPWHQIKASPQWQEAVRQTPGLMPFFDNLESFVELPEGVEKLREMILGLAMRGQLVEQDTNDEPAENLLARIETRRKELIEAGVLRKSRKESKLTEKEIPFSLPTGWAWIKLEPLMVKMGAGSTPLGGKKVYVDEGVMFLRSQNVWNDGLRLDDVARILPETHENMSGTHVHAGDVLLNITGASIGRCALVPDDFDEANVSQHVAILRLIDKDLRAFLQLCVVSPFFQETIMRVQVGVSREGLSMTRLKAFPFPVPPLAEQRRIVSKVEGLMSLCDTLEDARRARESVRERASRSVLVRLTSAPRTSASERPDATAPPRERQGPSETNRRSSAGDIAPDSPTASALLLTEAARVETLQSSWQRLSDHFEVLLDQPSGPAHLRQSILQLAVQGKLVPQDPTDEPANELMAKASIEREAIWKQCELAKFKHSEKEPKKGWDKKYELAESFDGDPLYEIPDRWEWITFDQILAQFQYGPRFAKGEYVDDGIPTLRTSDMNFKGQVKLDDAPKVRISSTSEDHWCLWPDDLIVTRTGATIGKCALYDETWGKAIASAYLIRFRFTRKNVYPQFILIYLMSPVGLKLLLSGSTEMAQPNVNATSISEFPIPLPPLAEQKRIVSKVSVLLSQLDELSARLRSRQSTTDALLTALIHQILEGV